MYMKYLERLFRLFNTVTNNGLFGEVTRENESSAAGNFVFTVCMNRDHTTKTCGPAFSACMNAHGT